MKITEVERKAERLIEKGEDIRRRTKYNKDAIKQAHVQMEAAQAQLERASEVDEEGNAKGDVAGARAQLMMVQGRIEALANQNVQLEMEDVGVKMEKQSVIGEVEQYNQHEQINLKKFEALQNRSFGGNVSGAIADLIARMNTGEAAKDDLLRSLGQSPTGMRHAGGGGGGGGGGGAYQGMGGASGGITQDETLQRRRNEVNFEYVQRARAIFADPTLDTQERRRQLDLVRAQREEGFVILDAEGQEPVTERTRGGSTVSVPAEKNQQQREAIASLREAMNAVIADESLTYAQKKERLMAIRQRMQGQFETAGVDVRGVCGALGASSVNPAQYAGSAGALVNNPVEMPTPITYKTQQLRQSVLNHPRFSGMMDYGNGKAYVFGMNDERLNQLSYAQGKNEKGWKMTCGIAQSAGILSRAGIHINEEKLVEVCAKNNWCDHGHFLAVKLNGGTSGASIATILSAQGVPAQYDYNASVEEISALVEQGHGVILGVNAGYLWNSYYGSAAGNGSANHAISVIGTVRDEFSHEVVAVFINDTGRSQAGDQKRLIPMSKLKEIYKVPYGVAIVTDSPIA